MKQFLYLLACLSLLVSCNKQKSQGGIKTYKAGTEITGELSGEVVFAGNGIHNYYDIAIMHFWTITATHSCK